MSAMFLWGGLTCIEAVPKLAPVPYAEPVGAILMIVGLILLILGR